MFPAQVNKGPLTPGQVIQVNRFTVQVERYLAQGGYAHVYLVRTPTPVYNTTHHVLKRMGVPNEAMLAEVKKEVDTMRLIQGHPNIVHLIDASWQKASNGTYEVYILMEYCPGGGIIDMMNRRLRERLTEAEILQIFVDVCEGVAYMHNLRPPLLHRDLKVENILQSSPTSYKLCDFGSAKAVSRSPTTNQEIRALEADLNKHTTLQYRAPEMIDLYQRRPVDEKSDVWALGVLLYKLCYYTTPFEEHPTLAILNVQYKFPPYPAYSPRMNQLIQTMLQEHGMRRPTVFELLEYVHILRGTKSRFKYSIPVPAPLSPRQSKVDSTNTHSPVIPHGASKPVSMSVSPSKPSVKGAINSPESPALNQTLSQPKSKNVDSTDAKYPEPQILPPMRRGRPTGTSTKENVPLSQPKLDLNGQKVDEETTNWLEGGFSEDNKQAWNPVSPQSTTPSKEDVSGVWKVDKKSADEPADRQTTSAFGDNFGEKLWNSFPKYDGKLSPGVTPLQAPGRLSPRLAIKRTSPALPPTRSRDAFEGLGLHLSPDKPAPTLGEARKLRTGLALMNANGFRTNPSKSPGPPPKLSPSPGIQSNIQLPLTSAAKSPSSSEVQISTPSARFRMHLAETPSSSDSSKQLETMPPESRFPSLEELDATFPTTPSGSSAPIAGRKGDTPLHTTEMQSKYAMQRHREKISESPLLLSPPAAIRSGSEQRTGSQDAVKIDPLSSVGADRSQNTAPRPKMPPRTSTSNTLHKETPLLRPLGTQTDWLTGDDHQLPITSSPSAPSTSSSKGKPILRDSPVKRASVIQAKVPIRDAISAEPDQIPEPELLISTSPAPPAKGAKPRSSLINKRNESRPEKTSERQPPNRKSSRLTDTESSLDEEGPEDAGSSQFRRNTTTIIPTATNPPRKAHKGRQSSVHDLVDLYGGGIMFKEKDKEKDHEQEGKSPNSHGFATPLLPDIRASSSAFPTPPSTSSVLLSPPPSRLRETTSREPISPGRSGRITGTSPARSRPQSMLLFPSKSTDSGISPASPQFPSSPIPAAPSSDERRRGMRRTSISDMVQRYEGGNGTSSAKIVQPLPGLAKSGAIPPSRVHERETGGRPTSVNERPSGIGGVRDPPAVGSQPLPGLHKPTFKPPNNSAQPPLRLIESSTTGTVGEARPRTMSSTAQERHGGLRKSPTRKSTISSSPPETRRIPLRHRVNSSASREGEGGTNSSGKIPTFPPPKPVVDNQVPQDHRSPSPERPYQGVGKLIDQWQRKTEEANLSRVPPSPKRIVAKRSGTLHYS